MAITFFLVILLAGGDDVLAFTFHLDLNEFVWVGASRCCWRRRWPIP